MLQTEVADNKPLCSAQASCTSKRIYRRNPTLSWLWSAGTVHAAELDAVSGQVGYREKGVVVLSPTEALPQQPRHWGAWPGLLAGGWRAAGTWINPGLQPPLLHSLHQLGLFLDVFTTSFYTYSSLERQIHSVTESHLQCKHWSSPCGLKTKADRASHTLKESTFLGQQGFLRIKSRIKGWALPYSGPTA